MKPALNSSLPGPIIWENPQRYAVTESMLCASLTAKDQSCKEKRECKWGESRRGELKALYACVLQVTESNEKQAHHDKHCDLQRLIQRRARAVIPQAAQAKQLHLILCRKGPNVLQPAGQLLNALKSPRTELRRELHHCTLPTAGPCLRNRGLFIRVHADEVRVRDAKLCLKDVLKLVVRAHIGILRRRPPLPRRNLASLRERRAHAAAGVVRRKGAVQSGCEHETSGGCAVGTSRHEQFEQRTHKRGRGAKQRRKSKAHTYRGGLDGEAQAQGLRAGVWGGVRQGAAVAARGKRLVGARGGERARGGGIFFTRGHGTHPGGAWQEFSRVFGVGGARGAGARAA